MPTDFFESKFQVPAINQEKEKRQQIQQQIELFLTNMESQSDAR